MAVLDNTALKLASKCSCTQLYTALFQPISPCLVFVRLSVNRLLGIFYGHRWIPAFAGMPPGAEPERPEKPLDSRLRGNDGATSQLGTEGYLAGEHTMNQEFLRPRLVGKDEFLLSMDDGNRISAQASWQRFIANPACRADIVG